MVKIHFKADMSEEFYCFRLESSTPTFLKPGSGVSEGRGELVVHMELLNGDFSHCQIQHKHIQRCILSYFFFLPYPTEKLTGVAKTNLIPLGSFMPIWAAVEQNSHQPLMLLMEECVAATTPELHPGSQVHPIIANKG